MTAAAICISGRQHRVGRYMHLDASKFMKQLADEAHAIVLCGGTMSAVSQRHTRLLFLFVMLLPRVSYVVQVGDIISNVFPTVQHRVDFKSFGHVVPPEAVNATDLVNDVVD